MCDIVLFNISPHTEWTINESLRIEMGLKRAHELKRVINESPKTETAPHT